MPCEVHYELSGPEEAPVVVFSNSLGTDLSMWDPQVAQLGNRMRVLRYDIRGHGRSPVPTGPYSIADLSGDLVALLDRLDLARVSICGLSIGGMTGIWTAANAPERVERVVICCSSAHLDPGGTYRERAALVRERGLEPIVDAALGRWFTPDFMTRAPEVVEKRRHNLLATPIEGYAGCCEAIAGMDLRGLLADVRAPTLVIAGRDDPATPPEHGRLIADGIAGARLEIVDGAAHLANLQQPETVGALIERHLLSYQ